MTSSSQAEKFAAQFRPRTIKCKYVDAYGWTGVKFPVVHDESRNLDVWLYEVMQWLRDHGMLQYTWHLVSGSGKDANIQSPAFYFKSREDALALTWRFSGELI